MRLRQHNARTDWRGFFFLTLRIELTMQPFWRVSILHIQRKKGKEKDKLIDQ